MRVCMLVLLVGCYAPSLQAGSPCDNGEPCPIGQECSPTTLLCEIVDDGKADQPRVTIVRSGNGGGTVTSTPSGIDCGADCSQAFGDGTSVTLAAAADTASEFVGWKSGGCMGTGACTFDLATDTTVEAMFLLGNSVGVSLAGTGVGTVTSSPGGIDCPGDCSEAYGPGQTVALTATPGNETNFSGWSGACTGTSPCTVVTGNPVSVTATFSRQQYMLSVGKSGNGAGTVTATGISCGTDCSEPYDSGSAIVLTASPSTSSTFTGWSGGGCSGTGSCTVTVTTATTVTATFTLRQFTLTVTKAGTGLGTVTSSPSGISCGTTCAATYNYGQVVTLIASPGSTSTFTGWTGGGCSGTGNCAVTITAATQVTAAFARTSLSCNLTNQTTVCLNGSIPQVNLGSIGISSCRSSCETQMVMAGMTSGCWIYESNACSCRSGPWVGSGSNYGGSCN